MAEAAVDTSKTDTTVTETKTFAEPDKTLLTGDQTGEAKTDVAKTEGDKTDTTKEGDKKETDKKDAAPVTIDTAALKLPEGFTAEDESSKGALKSLSEVLIDDKLSPQDRAQKLIDIYGGIAKQSADSQSKAWNDLQTQWVTEVKADKEIGGDKLAPTQQMISKAIDTLSPDSAKAFRQALDFTGAGNNPAIIKGLAAFAKLATEGSHVTGAPAAGKMTTAQEFFPNSPDMK